MSHIIKSYLMHLLKSLKIFFFYKDGDWLGNDA